MITTVSVTEVLRNFSDYVNRVAYRGERFVLVRGGKAVAALAPVATGVRIGDLPDLLASLPSLDEEEATASAIDLERTREELHGTKIRNPWGS